MKRYLLIPILIGVSGLLIYACATYLYSQVPYPQKSLVGRYILHYADERVEHLYLRRNGVFEQRFGNKQHFGTWQYHGSFLGSEVMLNEKQIFVTESTLRRNCCSIAFLTVFRTRGGPRLRYDADSDLWFERLGDG